MYMYTFMYNVIKYVYMDVCLHLCHYKKANLNIYKHVIACE